MKDLLLMQQLSKAERNRIAARKYYYAHKEQQQERHRLWASENKDYIISKQRENKRQRKIKAIDYLGGVCKRCGGSYHPAVFEFHHRNPLEKDRDPSKMMQLSWERITTELDKCELLCANCHRLEHHERTYAD